MKKFDFRKKKNSGFSLVEVMIGMLILLVGMLGVVMSYAWAVKFNAGNDSRMHSLAILQQEAEQLRSAKFTAVITDAVLLGGVKYAKIVTDIDGKKFKVETAVDDDPFVNGVQIDPTKSLKNITVTVTAENDTQKWAAAIPTTLTMRRARGN